MSAKFNAHRLLQARHLKRMTLEELGTTVGLTRQSLSQFEREERMPAPESVRKLANALDVPFEFFLRDMGRLESSPRTLVHYRALKKSRDIKREQQRAAAILALCAALVDTFESHIEYEPSSVPRVPEDLDILRTSLEDVEHIAEETRRALGLGMGPISDMTLLVENQSVIVAYVPLPEGMDGLSANFGDRPFMAVNSSSTKFRGRLNIAHEYGHLVLHHALASEEDLDEETFSQVEAQAWRFAGAFLLPQESFLADVYSVSVDALAQLKEKWGVSIGAMIQRLLDLGVIDREQQRYLRIQLSQRKWHKIEPGDNIPRERARLLKQAASFLEAEERIPIHEFALQSRLPIWFLAHALDVERDALLPTVPDNVVQFRKRSRDEGHADS